MLRKHGDLAHNFPLDAGTLCNSHMSNVEIVRKIEIYDLALETAIRSDGLAPSGSIIVDCLHDVGWDWILQKRRKSHQEIDCDIVWLERARHINHVVSSLRVAYED